MTRRISAEERQAMLIRRHGLVPGFGDPVALAERLVALHATDPATVYLSILSRLSEVDIETVGAALYDDRTLLRMLGMRRTMFVVSARIAPIVQAACSAAVAATERRKLITHLQQGTELTDVPGWLADVEESTFAALAARGEASATELADDEPRLRTQLHPAAGKPYAAPANITSRVLLLLAAEARIVRGRPTGSWTSTKYRWALMDKWLPGGMPRLDPAEARTELARLWLRGFGPATIADLKWWTGWSVRDTKQALAALATVPVDLDGADGLLLAEDLDEPPRPEPAAILLPALDPTPMGWVRRDWYLGAHRERLFDRSGNIGPTVWWDGRIVGGWAIRQDGEIPVRLLEDLGADGAAAVEEQARRLAVGIGGARPKTRFPTPLERELLG